MATIAVVTRVAEEGTLGNLALPADLSVELEQPGPGNGFQGRYENAAAVFGMSIIALRAPVFVLGEILVLGDSGREVGGRGRAPGEWDVDATACPTLEDAIALSESLAEG